VINYRQEVLKLIPQARMKEWLQSNPRPDNWNGDLWSWVYWYMPKTIENDVKKCDRSFPGQSGLIKNDVIF